MCFGGNSSPPAPARPATPPPPPPVLDQPAPESAGAKVSEGMRGRAEGTRKYRSRNGIPNIGSAANAAPVASNNGLGIAT